MNLRDMLNDIAEASPMGYDDPKTAEKPAIAPKVPKQTQGAERSAKAQDQRANEFNHCEFNKFMMKNHPKVTFGMLGIGSNLIKYQNEYLKSIKTGGVAESIDLNEFAPSSNMEVPINVLSNVMGDDTDVNLMRQALRQINNERGINKRFMPALKQFLSPYLTILSSGFTGYNQIMALQKALAQKTGEPVPAEPGMEPENIPEPSEEEILQYGNEVNMPTVTDQQKQEVADMIKKAQAGTLAKDKEAEKEKETMTASKYSEGVDELKRLAEIVEAMSDAYGEDQMVAPVELNPESPEQVEGSVEFKQHKNTDKGSVSVEASGETMQDLADVLKLAGLTLPQDMHKDEPEAHDEPEAEMPCDSEEPKDDKVMVVSPKDASYSTDKEVLVNYLKDKLKKSIS
jgi:hypothetical protein